MCTCVRVCVRACVCVCLLFLYYYYYYHHYHHHHQCNCNVKCKVIYQKVYVECNNNPVSNCVAHLFTIINLHTPVDIRAIWVVYQDPRCWVSISIASGHPAHRQIHIIICVIHYSRIHVLMHRIWDAFIYIIHVD